jgi:hypothetical protein
MSAHFARNIVAGTEPILACSGLLFCGTAQKRSAGRFKTGRFMRHSAEFFQTDTPSTHALLDESQNSSHNQNLKTSPS